MATLKTFPVLSVVVTVLNEATTIRDLLNSLAAQTVQPENILITDGGSTDGTLQLMKVWQKEHALKVQILNVAGNRSQGRNAAIAAAQTELIAITDAGCVADPDWLKELLLRYLQTGAGVVAGYYRGQVSNSFSCAAAPFFLVMPDRLKEGRIFLPATRSMLLEKVVWQELGGFDENSSDNEDYVFAQKILHSKIQTAFAQKALVSWQPPKDLHNFFETIRRFARGDAEIGLRTGHALSIFGRYCGGVVVLFIVLEFFSPQTAFLLALGMFVAYGIGAIFKNARYVGDAWAWLPVLQIASDAAFMVGTVQGWSKKWIKKLSAMA